MATYAFHPLANLFPEMEQDEYGRLVEDIKANGQLEPIWLYEGQILDGRHRYLACQDAKLEPITRVYEGDDPTSFVLSLNLHRRHLTESQRSIIASKLETMKHGDNQHTGGDANLHVLKREDAARLMNVAARSARSGWSASPPS
jgi:ParB-like nuclease domain